MKQLPNDVLELVAKGDLDITEIEKFKSEQSQKIITEVYQEFTYPEDMYTTEQEILSYIDDKFNKLKDELEATYNDEEREEILENAENLN